MGTSVMFLDCPAYLNRTGTARCGLPAAVEYRYAMQSTDGPLESVKIRCPRGHCFNGPVESLLWDQAGKDAAADQVKVPARPARPGLPRPVSGPPRPAPGQERRR